MALVPVTDERGEIGLLVVMRRDAPGQARLPGVDVDVSDATWQDAVVRAVLEQAGLSVTFELHVTTVSSPDGQVLIFAQTHSVSAEQVRNAGKTGATVMRSGDRVSLAEEVHARVVAQWFADCGPEDRAAAAADRRCAVTGRRAADAVALARTDAAGAVLAVHELVEQGASFSDNQYARALLERVLRSLVTDQRLRWGERGGDLLLTFLWHAPRDQLPVDDMFEFTADWARAQATADPAACFVNPSIDCARGWMDSVALAHGLGRVMAPVHVAEPVGLIRSILGFGRFGRLDGRLRGDTENVLTQLDEGEWELVYVALGARKPALLSPAAFDPDALLDGFADVLVRPERIPAGR